MSDSNPGLTVLRRGCRRSSPRALVSLLLAGVVLLAVRTTPAATFTVGGDGACSYNDLQLALLATLVNGPAADIIRVARNQVHTGEFLIDNQSVTIIGGYDTCADTTPSGQTVINRAADERAFRISGTVNGVRTIELVNLDIRFDGGVSLVQDEGGTIHISGGHVVSLQSTNVDGGSAARGGGIWVDGSILIVDAGSTIVFNNATISGGGIACVNGGSIGLLSGAIANNNADDGAGLHLDGCSLNSYIGGMLEGIQANTASGAGGGIWAGGGSTVNLIGGTDHPAVVSDNDADLGAGIYLTGSGTTGSFSDSSITLNDAVTAGGGIYLADQATATMERSYGADCHDPDRCSELSINTADGFTAGAAAYIITATLNLRQTYVESNTSPAAGGILYAGSGGQLNLEGVVIAGNTGNDMVLLEDDSSLVAAYVTSTNNHHPEPYSEYAFYSNGSAATSAMVVSSIIYELGGAVYGGGVDGSSMQWDCLVVHNALGLEGATETIVANPLFVDAAGGDYHLRYGSPAIDFCDTSSYTPLTSDIDGDARGQDDLFIGNHIGPYDLGADETLPPIFIDGFESGNTAAWSVTVS